MSVLGLVLYETFNDGRKFAENAHRNLSDFSEKSSKSGRQHTICVSVVTQGDYVDLVNFTLARNIELCRKVTERQKHNMPNFRFTFQLLTEKRLEIQADIEKHVQVLVIPKNYTTKTGVLFKARNLQYGLEKNVHILKHDDWIGKFDNFSSLMLSDIEKFVVSRLIWKKSKNQLFNTVHLDEETLMSEESVQGILDFCESGDRDFGHGLLIMSNNLTINWLLFAADSIVVAENVGHIRYRAIFHQ